MEDRKQLIHNFNELHNTAFKTITDIYYYYKSAWLAGSSLGVTGNTILNWVRQEGGTIFPKGGKRFGKRNQYRISDKDRESRGYRFHKHG